MNRCEVVGVRNLADDTGLPCTQAARQQCSDCGIQICGSHTETCDAWHEMFCPSCLSFHVREHSKPLRSVRSNRRERKSA